MGNALVVGASGMVGRYLVNELLECGSYDKVIVLVRSLIDFAHPKFEQRLVDFSSLCEINFLVNDVYCCLGTTIRKAGSKDAFMNVDFEYPVLIGELALKAGATSFGIVTSMGADVDSRYFYNQVKGRVEEKLISLGYERLLILRPSLLLGDRQEKRFGETVGKLFMQVFSFLIPLNYKAVHGEKVARAMRINMVAGKNNVEILSSGAIQNF